MTTQGNTESRQSVERVVHITVRIPKDCDADDVAQYAMDALSRWGGQFDPENDPLFGGVIVTSIYTSRKRWKIDHGQRDLA